MQEALTLLAEIGEADRQWILDHGNEQQVIAETLIVDEGTTPTDLWFVLEGLVGEHRR